MSDTALDLAVRLSELASSASSDAGSDIWYDAHSHHDAGAAETIERLQSTIHEMARISDELRAKLSGAPSAAPKGGLQALKDAIKKFEKVQRLHAESGASDTEPDGVFQVLLVKAAKGDNPEIPDDDRRWQLYDNQDVAAKALAAAARPVVEAIRNAPPEEMEEIRHHLAWYCWRCNI